MKRHDTDKDLFSAIQMLDRLARLSGRDIHNDALSADFLNRVSMALTTHKRNPMRLHGLRTQAMFAHVASALGGCRTITEEDAGSMFSSDVDIRRPDYRLVTTGGHQILVEVKNCHHADLNTAYRITNGYLTSLKKYADCMGMPLKLAIFWSRWKLWTLTDAADLLARANDSGISMANAAVSNEMHLLGDYLLAAVPPLTFRIYADQTKPCSLEADGSTPFTISRVEFYAGGVRIERKIEKQLAWFFILHSKWIETATPVTLQAGKVQYAEFQYGPADTQSETSGQPFEMLGFLSSMISNQYADATSTNGQVSRLTPTTDPDHFGIHIPADFKGDALGLWRFKVLPRNVRGSTNS